MAESRVQLRHDLLRATYGVRADRRERVSNVQHYEMHSNLRNFTADAVSIRALPIFEREIYESRRGEFQNFERVILQFRRAVTDRVFSQHPFAGPVADAPPVQFRNFFQVNQRFVR